MRRTRGIKDHNVGNKAVPEDVFSHADFTKSSERTKIRGARGVYDDTIAARAYILACLGWTNAQFAVSFGVDVHTIQMWLVQHPEFAEAVYDGKAIHDSGVQKSLLQRAMGYTITEKTTKNGTDRYGDPIREEITKERHIPGDPVCMQFWLKNRHPDEWQDLSRRQVDSHIKIDLTQNIEWEKLTPEEQTFIKKRTFKAISESSGSSSNK